MKLSGRFLILALTFGSSFTLAHVYDKGTPLTPEQVVQTSVDAYNAHNAERFASMYAPAVIMSSLTSAMKIAGRDEVKRQYGVYFATLPTVHCVIQQRTVMGLFVIDHQHITSAGKPDRDSIVISEVKDGFIMNSWTSKL